MTEANDRFAELTRRGHEVFTAAVQAWEQAVRSLAEAARRPEGGLPDIPASVDAAFDFAARMLADQREFAETVMSMSSQVVTATTQPAAPVTEPAAITAPDDSPGTGAGASTVEASPGAVGADRQQDTGGTAVVTVSPPRDSADTEAPEVKETKAPDTKTPDTKTPDTKAPDTKAPDTKAPETKAPETKAADTQAPAARKPAATKTPAARKPAAKTPTARKPAATKTAAPAAARATAAKKTAASNAATAADQTPPGEAPAPVKRSSPVESAARSGDGDGDRA